MVVKRFSIQQTGLFQASLQAQEVLVARNPLEGIANFQHQFDHATMIQTHDLLAMFVSKQTDKVLPTIAQYNASCTLLYRKTSHDFSLVPQQNKATPVFFEIRKG